MSDGNALHGTKCLPEREKERRGETSVRSPTTSKRIVETFEEEGKVAFDMGGFAITTRDKPEND